jgi:hypothetical protein
MKRQRKIARLGFSRLLLNPKEKRYSKDWRKAQGPKGITDMRVRIRRKKLGPG